MKIQFNYRASVFSFFNAIQRCAISGNSGLGGSNQMRGYVEGRFGTDNTTSSSWATAVNQ
jgi:hypothetical protein